MTCDPFPAENRTGSAPAGASPSLFGGSEKVGHLARSLEKMVAGPRWGAQVQVYSGGAEKVGLVVCSLPEMVLGTHLGAQVQLFSWGRKSWTCGPFPAENGTGLRGVKTSLSCFFCDVGGCARTGRTCSSNHRPPDLSPGSLWPDISGRMQPWRPEASWRPRGGRRTSKTSDFDPRASVLDPGRPGDRRPAAVLVGGSRGLLGASPGPGGRARSRSGGGSGSPPGRPCGGHRGTQEAPRRRQGGHRRAFSGDPPLWPTAAGKDLDGFLEVCSSILVCWIPTVSAQDGSQGGPRSSRAALTQRAPLQGKPGDLGIASGVPPQSSPGGPQSASAAILAQAVLARESWY